MNVKFCIIFEDGTIAESHDEMYNQKFDHAHFLPPNSNKRWREYQLITDDGHKIAVNFETGLFSIDGRSIHPADEGGGSLTYKTDPQEFTDVSEPWKIMNGLKYFPVVGRRIFKGDMQGYIIDTTLYFCGWKRQVDGKTIQKVAYLYPNGQVSIT